MKILITIPWFYPAYKAGGPVQSVINLVNEYNEDVNFYIFCGVTDLNDTPLTGIEKNKWVTFNDRTQVYYASGKNRSDTIVKITEKLVPDVLYVIGVFDWHFNIVPLFFGKAKHKILSVRGMLHPGALSQKAGKKNIFLFFFRLLGIHKKITFQVSDLQEEVYVRKVFGDICIRVATNFPRILTPTKDIIKRPGALRLMSLALISPMKNHLLVLESLSLVSGVISYEINGPVKEMQYWQLCLDQMKSLPVSIAVKYNGEVDPLNVQKVFDDIHVFILPSRSENFGHSIFEALSAGKPVITSYFTPWQGLEESKAGINVDSTPEAIAEAIDIFARMSQEEYAIWSIGAANYASASLNKDAIKKQYKELFKPIENEPAKR